ncbi:MAG: hypothetical protein NTV51_04395 [Verrucomicrobia bacterium]|nr:hypothetical protein [Verrucomicrobiota bacterium]
MAYKLIFFCGAFGVGVVALALVVMTSLAFAVWLGGSEWARRTDARPRA